MSNFKFWLIVLFLIAVTVALLWKQPEKPKSVKLITMMEVQQNLTTLGYLEPNDCDGMIGKKTLQQWSYAELHENEKRRMGNASKPR